MNPEIVSPEELTALKEQRSQLAVKYGLPPIGAKMVNQHGIEWLVDGHTYRPTLASLARDQGQLVPEHPLDLLPIIVPQNLSPRLLDFLGELDRCTSRPLLVLDTVPYLRPQQTHDDRHWVDNWADPEVICFFFDAAHIHETIIAHEVAHVWIDVVEDCEDHRMMRDLSDTARVRQVLYIQSFVLDRKVNAVIEQRGFDMSIIAGHQWDAVNWMAQAVAKGHRPALKREAVFSALTIAATLWEQGDRIKAVAADSLQPLTELTAALDALRQGVPVVYALAEDFAAAVRWHGTDSRAQLRCCIDECLRLAFEFTGEEFDSEKEFIEIAPPEPDLDKWPTSFRGWPVKAKTEIGRLMAKNKIPAGSSLEMHPLPTGQISVSFLDQWGQWTPHVVLQHAPPFLPEGTHLPLPLLELSYLGVDLGVPMPHLNAGSQRASLPHMKLPFAPRIPTDPTVPVAPRIPMAPQAPLPPRSPFGPPMPIAPRSPIGPPVPTAPHIPMAPHAAIGPAAPIVPHVPQLRHSSYGARQSRVSPPGVPPHQGGRSYMAGEGRWLSAARLQEQLGGEHPYTYAFNNPVRYVDPDGLAPAPGEGRYGPDATTFTNAAGCCPGDDPVILAKIAACSTRGQKFSCDPSKDRDFRRLLRSGNRTAICAAINRKIALAGVCLAARNAVTVKCYGGILDARHAREENEIISGITNCAALYVEQRCGRRPNLPPQRVPTPVPSLSETSPELAALLALGLTLAEALRWLAQARRGQFGPLPAFR